MSLSREEVIHIAKLARLELTDSEIERYQQQLSSILEYADRLMILTGCSPILAQRDKMASITPVAPATKVQPAETQIIIPTVKGLAVSGVSQTEILPGEPQGMAQVIHDQTCISTASEKKAPGGDEYSEGRFERPFDKDMNYLPTLDIVRAELVRASDGWVYFTIVLEEAPALPPALYGIELDLNIDGRGDLLVQVPAPASEAWSESGIKVWWDSDGDVGGQVVNRSDSKGYKGSGFESLKIDSDSGKDRGQAWSRIKDKGLQIALKEELIGGRQGKFTWQPIADGNPFSPSQYDLNDYYVLIKAGTPILGETNYPLKEVYALDNTCRGLSGLTPSGSEQGVCPP